MYESFILFKTTLYKYYIKNIFRYFHKIGIRILLMKKISFWEKNCEYGSQTKKIRETSFIRYRRHVKWYRCAVYLRAERDPLDPPHYQNVLPISFGEVSGSTWELVQHGIPNILPLFIFETLIYLMVKGYFCNSACFMTP